MRKTVYLKLYVAPVSYTHLEPGFDITGPIEARKAVRQFLFEGVDFIKAMVTGGLGKAGEDPGAVELELNELAAMVSEAAKHGKKVACHCHSRAGIDVYKRQDDRIPHKDRDGTENRRFAVCKNRWDLCVLSV